ncbi:hypothetical protein [Streptomyces sp. NPDC056194]|uniref:hypothetical protein n=1 Tax=unclassified Streptomyces TaxID=2593676 RepID=UPI0035E1A99A
MQAARETPDRPERRPWSRLHRARVLYRNVSKRKMAWLLLKDTVFCFRSGDTAEGAA